MPVASMAPVLSCLNEVARDTTAWLGSHLGEGQAPNSHKAAWYPFFLPGARPIALCIKVHRQMRRGSNGAARQNHFGARRGEHTSVSMSQLVAYSDA
jgi:hypothetical protein